MSSTLATWIVAGLATAGVIARPFRWPEAIWAGAGALVLVGAGLVPPAEAWAGVLKGLDVYLFLLGMMLISELAREEGVFDWLAAVAVAGARGSPTRLFALVYAVGTLVTVFLSNDATAIVLTPAVYAATRAAGLREPLPYLFVCALIANAASFVLPISNPANLVVFGPAGLPPEIIATLNRAVQDAVNTPEGKRFFAAYGSETGAMTPAEFAVFVKLELKRWEGIVAMTGLPKQ